MGARSISRIDCIDAALNMQLVFHCSTTRPSERNVTFDLRAKRGLVADGRRPDAASIVP